MQGLLDRNLTIEESAVKDVLSVLLAKHASEALPEIQAAAARSPKLFFGACLALLDQQTDLAGRRRLYGRMIECPEFLLELARPDRFSRARLLEVCRSLLKIDSLLDVRLARLTPGRADDTVELNPEVVLHVLDILDQISTGPRLVVVLTHLTHHTNARIAAKATLLMGRRLYNKEWVKRHLGSSDPRVRASLVEGFWGVDTPETREHLREALKDDNNRVVGNALMGLHLLGEPGIDELVQRMLQDSRPPFRWTAAWAMGMMGQPKFIERLELALTDTESGVRQAAGLALEKLRRVAATGKPSIPGENPEGVPEAVPAALGTHQLMETKALPEGAPLAEGEPSPEPRLPGALPKEPPADPAWSVRLDGGLSFVQ